MSSFFLAVFAIFRKDVQTELRSRELVATMGLFALISVLIFSFALELDREARIEAVSGVLYVTVVFASILGLNRGISSEREGGMDALLLAPIARTAVFVGKLLGGALFVLVVSLSLLPVMSVLYNVNLFQPLVVAALALGALGFTTIGTVLATITAQTRAREALLPLVMLPVTLPVLLSAVRATTGILRGAPQADWLIWLQILFIVNIIYLGLALLLYEVVLEE